MANTVGIVLVSHSAELATGLRDLVSQIAGDATVRVAGGTEDDRIGTSDIRIREAISGADGGAGVLVLTDLGSAVLTAKAVVADLGRTDILLVDAPFVEGAVAAAALAATGADLATVLAAAQEARHVPKL